MDTTLIDLIASNLRRNNERVKVDRLSDGSGSSVEVIKRKGATDYSFCLHFSGDGHTIEDISLFKGDVIESVEYEKVV